MTRPPAQLPTRLVDPDGDYPDSLEEAAREELVCLWGDLAEARRSAMNGVWSIACDGIVERVVALSRHVGAVPWGEVDVDLISVGLYERIHAEAGLEHPPVDWDAVATCRAQILRR
jgi:hypothetical protein